MAFEWLTVDDVNFGFPDGDQPVKLRYEQGNYIPYFEVPTEGETLVSIVEKYTGTVSNLLRVTELNRDKLVEASFDLSKIKSLRIPR